MIKMRMDERKSTRRMQSLQQDVAVCRGPERTYAYKRQRFVIIKSIHIKVL